MDQATAGTSRASIKAELKVLLNLLELKNEKPDDLMRDQKFLTASFEFLERHSECIWCQYTDICGELMRLFSFAESPPLKWFRDKTLTCLTSCRACIESYYGVRPRLFASFRKIYDEATVNEFERKIHQFDLWRLREPFETYLHDREKRKSVPIKFILFEILLFPGWIISHELSKLFEGVLDQIISSMKMVKISEKLPGVLVCSVHPNAVIRNWAKAVLNSDIQVSTENNGDYSQINFSWDTVVLLSKTLNDEEYSDAMYNCLKSSKADFVKSCSNWEWTSRIFGLLKKQDSGFLESLRLYGMLLKTLTCDPQFKWNKIPEALDSIGIILDSPSFSQGSHTEQDCANFVLDWIPSAVTMQLSDYTFKSAHKLVSDLMGFVLESRALFPFKIKIVEKFSIPLSEQVFDAYLLSKLCQLSLFLFDSRFAEFRQPAHEEIISKSSERLLHALIHNDFSKEKRLLIGTPSSAVFDVSNYRKYLSTIECRQVSLVFLNSIATEFRNHLWNRKMDLVMFLFRESLSHSNEIDNFCSDLVFVLIFYQVSFLKPYTSIEAQDSFFLKLIQYHPEKSLKALTEIIPMFLDRKFKVVAEGTTEVIPIEKTLYFFNSIIGKVFEKDTEILSIYPERNKLIYGYFNHVIISFFMDLNSFLSLSGGQAYYELAISFSSFFLLLDYKRFFIFLLSGEMIETTKQKSVQIVGCLAKTLMAVLQTSSKYKNSVSLIRLSVKLIKLCGDIIAHIEDGKVDQIIKVLLTSNIPAEQKSWISDALQEYCRKTGKKILLPAEAPKNSSGVTSNLDLSVSKKLEALERMDNEYINRHLSSVSNTGNGNNSTTLKPSSKLGQLRQELVREGGSGPAAAPSKKSRFVPIVVQKAPRMMTQADLIRARDDSSDSEIEAEITSDTFKNSSHRHSSSSAQHPTVTSQPHRSVKLIDIEDNDDNAGNKRLLVGQPISSKATVSIQMQRDWQCAQRLHRFILGLDYTSLDEKSLIETTVVQSIPDTFINYEKYLQTFEPLLQLECRAQIIQAKEENEGRMTYFKGIVQTVSMVDDFFEVIFNFGDDSVHRIFSEQDLIVGHPVHPHPAQKQLSETLGLVILTASRQKGFEVTVRFYVKGTPTRTTKEADPNLQFLTRLKQSWKFAKLCNTVTNNREFLALQNLPLYSSCSRILQPKFVKINSRLQVQLDLAATFYMRAFGLNPPQASAIAFALLNPNFFTLIQGPPGTGKTRTIEGFMSVLFGRPSNEFRVPIQCKRILVCAPSNAAIDEIVRRLKNGVKDSYGHFIPLRIVRVGSTEMIHDDVKDLSIDGIVETMIQGHIASALEMVQTNRKQLEELKELLNKAESNESEDELVMDDEEIIDKKAPTDIRTLKTQLWQVKENIRKGTKFIEDSRQNLRVRVLNEAQIVCCTLSASGHEVISRIDGEFELVIIDEACQAIELSALIPLQYGCKRAVLVGDPNQLSPTVISQKAVTFSYEQSLFQRLQKIDPSSVQLLSLQYRMHPDISAFPSAYFYNNRLANGPNVLFENTRPWHGELDGLLGPCKFFDVPGQEQVRTFSSGKQGNSMLNELEAKITCSLIASLSNSSPDYNFVGKIGIITPYKEQRRLISRELAARFGPEILQSIEVSTVDGYQGQEKEIIIFSCVRTGDKNSSTIGFLNDSRRLNVAITRAKCSLFLLGKSSVLLQNPLWRSLIEDFKQRKMFVPFNSNFWQEQKKLSIGKNFLL